MKERLRQSVRATCDKCGWVGDTFDNAWTALAQLSDHQRDAHPQS